MSDWIKKKAKEYQQRKADIEYHERLIGIKKFWQQIIEQIKNDIITINQTKVWNDHLQNPIKIEKKPLGYIIKKTPYPCINIFILCDENKLETRTIRIAAKDARQRESVEKYQVISEDGKIVLRGLKNDYNTPEKISELVLQPILDSILESLE